MNIIFALILVAVLVCIHEFGHFIVAKACGVHVRIFSIGFGRRLIGVNIGGTDVRLSLLPFGGYVSMAGADPFGDGDEDDDELDDPSQALMRKPVWQRLLVVSAGPAANLLLPFVIFTILLMAGEPQWQASVGDLQLGSPAAEAGLEPGDLIVGVDDEPIDTWEQFVLSRRTWSEGEHRLAVLRGEEELTIEIAVDSGTPLGFDPLRPDAMVGVDDPASPAGQAGLQTGDRITSVQGEEIANWVDLELVLADQRDPMGQVRVWVEDADGLESEHVVRPDALWASLAPLPNSPRASALGLTPATLVVGSVGETLDGGGSLLSGCTRVGEPEPSPARAAGITKGDRWVTIDGDPIYSWGDVLEKVAASVDAESDEVRAIEVVVAREGRLIRRVVTPRVVESTDAQGRYLRRPLLGVSRMGGHVEGPTTRIYFPFPEAFSRASRETIAIAGFIVEQIGKLITGEAAMDKSLGGPVEIVRQASMAAEEGLFTYARLMGMLSISLGIINLLPVPVLDGGQFLFYAIEGIRGRPLSVAIRERAQQAGVLFLVVLMLSVLVFDIHRLFQGGP